MSPGRVRAQQVRLAARRVAGVRRAGGRSSPSPRPPAAARGGGSRPSSAATSRARARVERRERRASARASAAAGSAARRPATASAATSRRRLEPAQDAAQIAGVEAEVAAELGRRSTRRGWRQLVEHAHLGQREIGVEIVVAEDADLAGVEAVEGADRVDVGRRLAMIVDIVDEIVDSVNSCCACAPASRRSRCGRGRGRRSRRSCTRRLWNWPSAPRGERVAEHVLAVQLLGDARRRFVELRRVLHDLGAAAALGGDLAQRLRVDPRVDRLALGRIDGDRVDERVAAPQRRPHVAQRCGARRVGAVRDHQERGRAGACASRSAAARRGWRRRSRCRRTAAARPARAARRPARASSR